MVTLQKPKQPYFIQGKDFVYVQSTGIIYLADAQDVRTPIGQCYSGAPDHVNRPESQAFKCLGPIPAGMWLVDAPASHPRLGPVSIGLEAKNKETARGRSGFYIHGDNNAGNFTASTGCIIATRATRNVIAALYWAGVRTLTVEQ